MIVLPVKTRHDTLLAEKKTAEPSGDVWKQAYAGKGIKF